MVTWVCVKRANFVTPHVAGQKKIKQKKKGMNFDSRTGHASDLSSPTLGF